MKFGRGIYDIQEHSYRFEEAYLATLGEGGEIYLGLPQWGSPEWKGYFYRSDTQSRDFLSEYSKLLNCVEVSSTFYSPVGRDTLLSWQKSVDKKFRFLPKWPKFITHDRFLGGRKNEIFSFIKSMEFLGENLGTTLLQLPPAFSREYTRALYHFLLEIPSDFPICLEFRHKSWFEEKRVYSKLEDYLVKNHIGMICSDTPAFPDLCHMSFTGKNHVIRYASDEIRSTDEQRLGSWRKWLAKIKSEADIYFILHQPDNTTTTELISLFSPTKGELIKEYLRGPQGILI